MIKYYPSSCLRDVSKEVVDIDASFIDITSHMRNVLLDKQGLGLAAPQIGILSRVFLMNVDNAIRTFINPRILWSSDETVTFKEGCLSIPKVYADVTRPAKVGIEYTDINGSLRNSEEDGLAAICIQHEIDHLDGVLFIDHLSKLKKDFLLKKYRKLHK